MKILSRKRQEDLDSVRLAQRLADRFPVHIDIGTGSGRMMLAYAKRNAQGLYIGMDPYPESMHENSARAAKQKLKTCFSLWRRSKSRPRSWREPPTRYR